MALPSGYTQLEHIQSSGTQYINTGFKPNQNTRIVMDVQAVGTSGTYFAFGARQSTTSNAFCLFFYNGWAADYQTGNQRKTFSSIAFTDRLKIDFDKTICTVNGQTATFTAATFQSPVEMMLLAVNTNGTIANTLAAKLYSCKIYDNGTLVRDFVPAKNSAGTVGLYDLANGVFYTNAGSGAFTAGPLATGPVDGEGVTILGGASFAIKEGTAMMNGVARKITEGMTILGGAAKKIAVASGINVAAMVIGYTGAYTDQKDVTMSGKKYRLLTLTGSGTLTVAEDVTAEIWMCSGGTSGNDGSVSSYNYAGGGGAGGFTKQFSTTLGGEHVATIGAGGSTASANSQTGFNAGSHSSFGDQTTSGTFSVDSKYTYYGTTGGTGGGGGGGAGGSGDGVPKTPFADSSFFVNVHCGGGGGGGTRNGSTYRRGGAGGTNGGNGLAGSTGDYGGGAGGAYGGGAGGQGYSGTGTRDGSAATYFGSGGGGGGSYGGGAYGTGGAGYQGVIYIRIPYEQE